MWHVTLRELGEGGMGPSIDEFAQNKEKLSVFPIKVWMPSFQKPFGSPGVMDHKE